MDSDRNYKMEIEKDKMASAIGIKGNPITLYPLLNEEQQNAEIDRATKPPCHLSTGDIRKLLCSPSKRMMDDDVKPFTLNGKRGPTRRHQKENWDEEEVVEEDDANVEVIEPAVGEEDLAKVILLKNPRCQYEYNVILAALQKQRHAREAFESVEDCARNALADVWCLQWEELFDLCTESQKRAVEMKRDRLAKDYRHDRLRKRREELEQKLTEKEEETLFHSEELLRELDGIRGVDLWREQLSSFFYNTLLSLEGGEVPAQIEA